MPFSDTASTILQHRSPAFRTAYHPKRSPLSRSLSLDSCNRLQWSVDSIKLRTIEIAGEPEAQQKSRLKKRLMKAEGTFGQKKLSRKRRPSKRNSGNYEVSNERTCWWICFVSRKRKKISQRFEKLWKDKRIESVEKLSKFPKIQQEGFEPFEYFQTEAISS